MIPDKKEDRDKSRPLPKKNRFAALKHGSEKLMFEAHDAEPPESPLVDRIVRLESKFHLQFRIPGPKEEAQTSFSMPPAAKEEEPTVKLPSIKPSVSLTRNPAAHSLLDTNSKYDRS